MRERPENFKAAGGDPEATLVAPRFDADDARRAHPVVPLADVTPRASYGRRRAPRRSWTPALFAVALLAVAAVGGAVATKVMQSLRAERVQEQPQAEQTQAAPVQTAEAPTQPSTPPAGEATGEDARAATPIPRRARTRRQRAVPEPKRYEVENYQNEDRELREIREEIRREREKEMRKALKRAKDKAPRLVDVLGGP